MKGTVVKRGDKWAVVVDVGRDPSGKRIRKWHSGFDRKKDAEAARVEILSKLAQGVYVPPSRQTVGEWLETWLAGRQGLAETTKATYEHELRRLTTALGSRRLRDLTPALLSSFYSDLINDGLSPKSVKNTHAIGHKAFSDAVRQGLIPRNPADHVELPRSERPETVAWTADELRRFLAHIEDDRLFAAWVLITSTGLRRSELLGCRWQNLELEAGKLAVVDTVVMVRGQPTLRLGETKSRGSRRVVALDARTMTVLKAHKSGQNAEKLIAGPAYEDQDLVFSDELGRMVSPAWFTRATKRLAVAAKVAPLAPHAAARHTWATLALEAGVHAKVVQERLGHSSISITLDRYSHVIEGMDRDAAEKVAALFR